MHVMKIFKGVHQNIRAAGTNLVYQGGAVEPTPVVYISWWGTQWNTGFSTGGYTSAQAQTYITDFFNNIGGTRWDNINTQYCQGIAVGSTSCGSGGTHITNPTGQLAGTWVDTTSVPTRPTQSNIQSAATRLMTHFGGYNANATYFVFTPTGHSMRGFGTSWCAWHDEPTSGTNMAYAYMPYIPDAGANCGRNFVNPTNNSYGNGYFDGFSIVGGHEMPRPPPIPIPSARQELRAGSPALARVVRRSAISVPGPATPRTSPWVRTRTRYSRSGAMPAAAASPHTSLSLRGFTSSRPKLGLLPRGALNFFEKFKALAWFSLYDRKKAKALE